MSIKIASTQQHFTHIIGLAVALAMTAPAKLKVVVTAYATPELAQQLVPALEGIPGVFVETSAGLVNGELGFIVAFGLAEPGSTAEVFSLDQKKESNEVISSMLSVISEHVDLSMSVGVLANHLGVDVVPDLVITIEQAANILGFNFENVTDAGVLVFQKP